MRHTHRTLSFQIACLSGTGSISPYVVFCLGQNGFPRVPRADKRCHSCRTDILGLRPLKFLIPASIFVVLQAICIIPAEHVSITCRKSELMKVHVTISLRRGSRAQWIFTNVILVAWKSWPEQIIRHTTALPKQLDVLTSGRHWHILSLKSGKLDPISTIRGRDVQYST